MEVSLRPYLPSDHDVLEEALGALAPEYPTDPGNRIRWRCFVAVRPDEDLVGYSSISAELYGQPQKAGCFFVKVAVLPRYRRQGAGSRLYKAVLDLARDWNALELACSVAPDDPDARAFAQRRGFVREYEMLAGELDLVGFNEAPWLNCLTALETRGGVRFTTLRDAPDQEQTLAQIYRLDEQVSYDVPQWQGLMPPYSDYRRELLAGDPDGVILAFDGPSLIGFMITVPEEHGTGYTTFMGVSESHRGWGIALVLKLLTIRWAKARGLRLLHTHNNVASAAIVGLNRKLGYVMRTDAIYLRLVCGTKENASADGE